MFRRGSFVALVFVALLGAIVSGCSSSGQNPLTGSSGALVVTPATPNHALDFQIERIVGAAPSPGNALNRISADYVWGVESSLWCKSGMSFGIVFVRNDGKIIPENTTALCAGEDFRRIALGGRPFSGNQNLLVQIRGQEIVAEYATVSDGFLWGQTDKMTVRSGSLNIHFLIE